MTEWSVCFQGKPFIITVSLCHSHYAEEAEVGWFCEDLQDFLELTPKKKDVLFILGDWNEKVGSQEIPGITGKFGLRVQNEARQRLTEFCQENALVIALSFNNRRLHMYVTRWSISKSDWLHSLQPKIEKLYIVSKTRLGADCGSDHELLIAKFRLKLKKVEKTTRPFRYDRNQILYDHTVEVRNRFKN